MVVKVGFILLFFILTLSFIQPIKSQKTNLVIKTESILEENIPVKLMIPTLNINAKIQSVGITKDGNMDVPNNTQDVGLFSLGPKPGEIGSSVITGHFDDKNGDNAVFYNLDKLVKGDKIFVEDNNNKKIAFIVQEIRKFDEKYAEEVFSTNDTAHLNLITCNGVWDKTKNSYDNRLVVFSDRLIEI